MPTTKKQAKAPKAPKAPKERKLSAKQVKILEVLAKSAAPMTPSEVGVQCGMAQGSPAADWAYPAIKSLVTRGSVTKPAPGRYALAADSDKEGAK